MLLGVRQRSIDWGQVTTPVIQLRGFERLAAIAPGKSTTVTLPLDAEKDLWLVDLEYKKVVEPGEFTVFVGGSSDTPQRDLRGGVIDRFRYRCEIIIRSTGWDSSSGLTQ